MKNLIIVLSVLLTAITTVSAQTEGSKTIYVCPEHSDMINSSSVKWLKCVT